MEHRLLRGALLIAQSTLRNMATALEMWAVDHGRQYPNELAQLTPNYLRELQPGPTGTAEDWVYQRSEGGESYRLRTRGTPFAALGLEEGLPRYEPGRIEPTIAFDALDYAFELPAALEGWRECRAGHSWDKGKGSIRCYLSGPYSPEQAGMDWVKERVRHCASFEHSVTESESPVEFGELRGIEVRSRFHHLRSHRYVLTDGELGWECFYCAPEEEWDDAVDSALPRIVESRRKA